MRIHYLQHVPFENPGNIVKWAYKKGHKLTGTHLYNYETVPEMDQFDFLVIMGGPMNIYEEGEYEWLKYEKKFIKETIDNNKIVLGICLGAQLITEVLGGKVTKNNEKEIGFFPVNFNEEALESPVFRGFLKEFPVFQWHGDTFSELGKGVSLIAASEACSNQAFVYKDRVIGFQFHMESLESNITSLIENCREEMTEGKYIQTEEVIKSKLDYLNLDNRLMNMLLDSLEEMYLKSGKV